MANIKKDKKYFFIYKTTNLINEKYYIGMHSTSNLKDGYLGSGKYLRRSIRKHGKENFRCEVLEFCESWEKLVEKEKELVHEELIKDPLCMNLKPGGRGGLFSREHLDRVRIIGGESLKRKLETDPEFRKDHCKRASDNMKLRFLQGRRQSLPSWKGKTHTRETKLLMSKSKKETTKGEGNSQFGTCWITKEGINKKVKKEELVNYLILGWNKGRKV